MSTSRSASPSRGEVQSGAPHDDPASSLDLFILTFNAGKEKIDSLVFADHLRDAFSHSPGACPEIIVICLQEMAPLENSFIGGYMINPYFQSWVTAVNGAARSFFTGGSTHESSVHGESENDSLNGDENESPSVYTLMTTRNVGMTGILLFARNPGAIQDLKSTEVGFGAGDMANKGAVGLRMTFFKTDSLGQLRHTVLTFVGTHLAAHEWNLEKRNKNWASIVSGLLFEDPKKLNGGRLIEPTPCEPSGDEEREALLRRKLDDKALHHISIYKPGSHLFVAGDLNYRISKTSPTPKSIFPDLNPASENYYSRFLPLDQLRLERVAGRTLHGLSEGCISFPPTYKLKHKKGTGTKEQRNGTTSSHKVEWDWAPNRWPGWCDRVLYLDIPPWVPQPVGSRIEITPTAYDALPAVRTSDHRAVFLRIAVPVVEPAILGPSDEVYAAGKKDPGNKDPRIKLPCPIDFESWDHRARVKKWEWLIGWSMIISQSKQGIAVFTALFFVGVGTWWLRSR